MTLVNAGGYGVNIPAPIPGVGTSAGSSAMGWIGPAIMGATSLGGAALGSKGASRTAAAQLQYQREALAAQEKANSEALAQQKALAEQQMQLQLQSLNQANAAKWGFHRNAMSLLGINAGDYQPLTMPAYGASGTGTSVGSPAPGATPLSPVTNPTPINSAANLYGISRVADPALAMPDIKTGATSTFFRPNPFSPSSLYS